jgi:chemotaxis protein CheD
MNKDDFRGKAGIRILPGEYYGTNGNEVITTLLGSCVACCLYDPVAGVSGMNHFMLSNGRYARDLPLCISEAGRYGIHAMELLINRLFELGAEKRRLRAKVFGGASIMAKDQSSGNFFCVGDVNCKFIREFLANERIPVLAEDLGGATGRVIHFDTGDQSVMVRRMQKRVSIVLAKRDQDRWREDISLHEQSKGEVEIWD